jgi:hypothetical protein
LISSQNKERSVIAREQRQDFSRMQRFYHEQRNPRWEPALLPFVGLTKGFLHWKEPLLLRAFRLP